MKQKHIAATLPILLALIISGCAPVSSPTPPPVATTAQPTSLPTDTALAPPTSTSSPEPTQTLAPTYSAGQIKVSPKDGMEMVYIPAGTFEMGSSSGLADEQPVHTVHLGAYWIDKMEVSNVLYSLCVQAGDCLKPYNQSNTHFTYYSDPTYANYPVIDLKWGSVDKYCTWAGRRLPTEAEWEMAARGTDGRIYPWGNGSPQKSLLNFNSPVGDTVRVGSYRPGASPFGVLDMAGNVMEWVDDWYDAYYYRDSPAENPTGPATGVDKVMRGGSWHSDVYYVRSTARFHVPPNTRAITVGFRCALSAE